MRTIVEAFVILAVIGFLSFGFAVSAVLLQAGAR